MVLGKSAVLAGRARFANQNRKLGPAGALAEGNQTILLVAILFAAASRPGIRVLGSNVTLAPNAFLQIMSSLRHHCFGPLALVTVLSPS